MDARSAANRVIKAICRGDRTDMALNPLMMLIMILAYVIFSVYYMYIVHSIEAYADLPFFFSLAVLILVLIACSMPLLIIYLLLIRNRRHSKRESDLRAALIDYLASQQDGPTGPDGLNEIRKKDEEIRENEKPASPKNVIYLAASAVIVSVIVWVAPYIHEHLGEVSYILIVAFLLIGMSMFPSITSMPYEHEDHFIEFYGLARASFQRIGIELSEFPATIKETDYDKMRTYSILTLGLYSVYWAYVCLSSMNKHFAAHRKAEFEIIGSIKAIAE